MLGGEATCEKAGELVVEALRVFGVDEVTARQEVELVVGKVLGYLRHEVLPRTGEPEKKRSDRPSKGGGGWSLQHMPAPSCRCLGSQRRPPCPRMVAPLHHTTQAIVCV